MRNIMNGTDLNAIFFPVEKDKSSYLFKGFQFARGISHTIYRPGIFKVLNHCSGDYCLNSNESLIMPVYEQMIKRYGENAITVKVRNIEDKKFYVSLIINTTLHKVQAGDMVNPTVEIQNSYDGSLRSRVAMGYNRVICTNGMMAFTKEMQVMKKHVSGEIQIGNLSPFFGKIDNQIANFTKLTDRRLTPKEMKLLMDRIKTHTSFPKGLLKEVPETIAREQQRLDVPLNLWMLYNGFNYQLNHADTKKPPEFRGKIDREVLGQIEMMA